MTALRFGQMAVVALAIGLGVTLSATGAELQVSMPLGRTAYQTNEWIDVAILRTAPDALAAGTLAVHLTADHGGGVTAAFAVGAAGKVGNDARRTEHLHLNGWLLRPGHYTVEVACDGATAKAEFDVCSHVRKTTFRLIDWGGSGNGADQVRCGEDSTGVNLMYGSYGGHDQNANIRGGIDYLRNCTMGGAHQMDGRLECDWSDPYVIAGGMARVARQALNDRTAPNAIGVHFYDEPGLTWNKHPKTGVFSPHNIATQDWAWQAAFGTPAMQYTEVDPNQPATVDRWEQWLRWKQCFMEGAWRLSAFSTNYVQPDYLTATQSMYGWIAFGDGYYFNIVRPLSVMSGHGGYDDYAGGYLAPGFFFEMGRMRDYHKPVWFLPGWWENQPSDLFRLEQYLTFMMHPQGVAVPPGVKTENPGATMQDDGVVEANKLMARLGTVFAAAPVTLPDVAVLYSMSQNVKAMAESKDQMNGQDFPGQVERLMLLFTAAKMAHLPLWPVVEEDILDGTVAANHKAIVLTGIQRLEPRVVAALSAFAAGGGKVILSDECTVQIPGSIKLGATVSDSIYVAAQKEYTSGDEKTRQRRGCTVRSAAAYYREGAPIAKALAERCREAGITPVVECSEPQVFAARHVLGDAEYLFLVNASSDPEGIKEFRWNAVKAAQATVAVPADGRPLYDAAIGGTAREFKAVKDKLAADLRFGPGQARVFARTARPIGGVQVAGRVSPGSYTLARDPRTLNVQAVVTDNAGKVLDATLPLAVQVVDPLGVKRYDLYRAATGGVLRLELQLGANEPAGNWQVIVRDLLANTEGRATVAVRTPPQCGALAGLTARAVYFPADYENIFRFFRVHKQLAIVTGTADYHQAQAERLAANLKPWGITCQIVPAASIKKLTRPGLTWVGAYQNPEFDMPADGAILLGSLEDNPITKTLINAGGPGQPSHALPYVPVKDVFPGRGRGMLAWQTDCVAFYNYETVTCIAHDADGLAEAVGTLFEIASGYQNATQFILPATAAVTAASQAPGLLPAARVAWEAFLPDRAVSLTVADNQAQLLSLDGSVTTLGADGKAGAQKTGQEVQAQAALTAYTTKRPAPALEKGQEDPAKVAKYAAKGGTGSAVVYWGGMVRIFDAQGRAVTEQMLPQDSAGGMVWLGDVLVVPLADGRVLGLQRP